MKLYYSPGSCSLSPHIILVESGLSFSLESVSFATKKTASGADFYAINPKGQVPTLQLDDGSILTEGPAIVQYVADKVPEKNLLAPVGDLKRYQTISWLNYISSEIHKSFGPLFNPASNEESKLEAIKTLKTKFTYIETVLSQNDYITGSTFTVADAYLYTVLGWKKVIPSLPDVYPATEKYMALISNRTSVKKALEQVKLNK